MPEPAALTYDDLVSFPDDGLRRELLDGVLVVTASPVTRHQRIVGRLHYEFEAHLREHGGGEVFVAPLDVVLTPHDVVEPDVLFVAADQTRIATEKNIQGPPALVIEVVSDSRIDRVRKRDVYARERIAEYWIVDPDADRVEIYRPDGATSGRYGKPEILEPGDTLTYARLPGLAIDVAGLLAR